MLIVSMTRLRMALTRSILIQLGFLNRVGSRPLLDGRRHLSNAELRSFQTDDDRLATRTRVLVQATSTEQQAGLDLTVHDVSATGLLLVSGSVLPSGSLIAVDLLGVGTKEVRIVWSGDKYQGAEFLRPLSPSALKAVCSHSKVVWPTFAVNPLASNRSDSGSCPCPVEDAEQFDPVATPGLSSGLKIQAASLLSICLWALVIFCARSLIG